MSSTRSRTVAAPRRWRWLAAAATTIACTLTAVATAQQTAGRFGERVDVELVNVDVWVTDKKGEPVTGLDAGGFQLLHNGQPVPISHFVEVRGGEIAAGSGAGRAEGAEAASPPPAAPPSHLVAYFDQSRLHPMNVKALASGFKELLAAGEVATERVLILRQRTGLSVEAPFGSSREQLEAALDRIAKGDAAGMDLETEGRLAKQAIRSAWEQSQDSLGSGQGGLALVPDVANPTGEPGGGGVSSGGSIGGLGPDACGSFVSQVQPTLDSWVRMNAQRVAISLANLSDAASFLAGLRGVKLLLYMSDGLDTQPGASLATYASDLCPGASADLLSSTLVEGMEERFVELTRHANSNRVTIHALQAGGLRAPGSASAVSEGSRGGRSQRSSGSFEARKRSGERQGLSLIAAETGGRTVFNRNEFGSELVEIGREAGSYYSLAYPLPPGDEGRRSHEIEVRLRDDSLLARYRRGYQEKGQEEWLTERIEGALNLGITDNQLGVSLGAGAVRAGEEGTWILPLQVRLPAERLAFLPRGEEYVAEVVIKVLARSLQSNVLAMNAQSFRLKGAPGATGLVALPIEIDLGPGPYLAALGVRDQGTGEASFISTTLIAQPGG